MKYNRIVYGRVSKEEDFVYNTDTSKVVYRPKNFSPFSESEDFRFEIVMDENGELSDEEAFLFCQEYVDNCEKRVRTYISTKLKQIVEPYMQEERETWDIQNKEVELYRQDVTNQTPFLDALSAARGISKEDLSLKIEENVALYKTAVATLLGFQQMKLDQLKAITKLSDLLQFKPHI
jgi:hypothetical protein